jgi:hypothetical protein
LRVPWSPVGAFGGLDVLVGFPDLLFGVVEVAGGGVALLSDHHFSHASPPSVRGEVVVAIVVDVDVGGVGEALHHASSPVRLQRRRGDLVLGSEKEVGVGSAFLVDVALAYPLFSEVTALASVGRWRVVKTGQSSGGSRRRL